MGRRGIAMDLISTALTWSNKLVATWYGAAIIGGLLILVGERFDSLREPSKAQVQRTAELYFQQYGDKAMAKIGEHMLAANFAQDGRHKKFLRLVAEQLRSIFVCTR